MSTPRSMKWLVVAVAVLALVALAGCARAAGQSGPAPSAAGDDQDDWVVVTFEGDAEFDGELMDSLLETEVAADDALQAAEEGALDGNEIGDGVYQLFFVGADRFRMWAVLRPVMDQAPVKWQTAELLNGLEDREPSLIRNS